jgi:hypothetical protein
MQPGGKAISPKQVDAIINKAKEHTNQVLQEIEQNFRTTIQAHITHYRFLEEEAESRGDEMAAIYYKIGKEIYEQILASYSLSNSYTST